MRKVLKACLAGLLITALVVVVAGLFLLAAYGMLTTYGWAETIAASIALVFVFISFSYYDYLN